MRAARRCFALVSVGALIGLAAPGIVAPQPAQALPTLPIENAFTPSGPYATTTTTVSVPGHAPYALFYPADYAPLGFASPIVTWGNGTDGTPSMYSTLLGHFASYGFTVIASTLTNTGSGREISAAARYLVDQNTQKGSPFYGHLDVDHIASVGHSQGATGAVRAATANPDLITAVMTFSLPAKFLSMPNPDCPTSADCTAEPGLLTQPIFLMSTFGSLDQVIDNPVVARGQYDEVPGHAAMGVVLFSGNQLADHISIQDRGGDPHTELGYATAWLEYQLRGDAQPAGAFSGARPEILANPSWPLTAIK
jgi:pimeloyl-ACP methyl ester carboxylesterase